MPIIKFRNKVIYFSHIPKCGGTSIENFLKIITGERLSFLDRNFLENTNSQKIFISPQHMTGKDISKLFPITFFDAYFTVTRHPFDRFYSAFIFHKYLLKTIPLEIDVNQFANKLNDGEVLLQGHFDNHFLPQVNFLYPGAPYQVFKLENGLDNVKKHIGLLFDIDVKNIPMNHSLKSPKEIIDKENILNYNSKIIIKNIYKLDFNNFNY
jgi:hypothetical protein